MYLQVEAHWMNIRPGKSGIRRLTSINLVNGLIVAGVSSFELFVDFS